MDNIINSSSEIRKKFCYWSIGNKECALVLRTAVRSARNVGITEDFHVWTDRQIDGAINHYLDSYEAKHLGESGLFFAEFKFKYLKKMLDFDYDYYIFFDADTYFVRKPRNPLTLLRGDPMHIFLQTNLVENQSLNRSGWHYCPLTVLIKAMRDMGVTSKKIYNVNGGFFIIAKEHVTEMVDLVYKFWWHMHDVGYDFTEEPPLSYAMHMMCKDTEKHLLADNLDFYGNYVTDFNTAKGKNKLPGKELWTMGSFFTDEKFLVSPAIVHCVFSKKLLLTPYDLFFRRVKYALRRGMGRIERLLKTLKEKIKFF